MFSPNSLLVAVLMSGVLALITPPPAFAQSTAAQILEQARTHAREIEDLRKVLNGPDQNMRLAVFDAMVKSGDEALRLLAYETGLASADSVLRAMAFKALVMRQNNIHVALTVDPSAPKPMQEASAQYLNKNSASLVVPMESKNLETGSFTSEREEWKGQVSGTEFMFSFRSPHSSVRFAGAMTLRDDNTLSGVVHVERGGQFLATARLH